jgi:putative FmdB family regulatory protein
LIMPLYDFECVAGHRFERLVPVAERHLPIACPEKGCGQDGKAIISHSNPAALLDHGFGRNNYNAQKGTYDPNRPATNVMAKGRVWRK